MDRIIALEDNEYIPSIIPTLRDFEKVLVEFKGDYDPELIRRRKYLRTGMEGYNVKYQIAYAKKRKEKREAQRK